MNKPALLHLLWITLSSCLAMPAFARKQETGFLDRSVSFGGVTYRYQVFLPANFDPHKKWPIVLFLHGAGRHWMDPAMQAQALAALEHSVKEFKDDRERIYVTGISMGGYATWDLAAKYPGKFAAYVVLCGGIRGPDRFPELHVGLVDNPKVTDPYAETARRIGQTPVWIFHGGADPAVPVEESRKMVQALEQARANVRYTEYPGVGHNSWDKAYAEPGLFEWLLQQKLSK